MSALQITLNARPYQCLTLLQSHVASLCTGKEARVPGRLQTPNANQSMLYDSKDMRQGKTSMVASHVCSTMAGSSSSIKAACQCHNTAMRPTTSCRDAKDNHSKTSRLFSCRALPVQSCFTPAQGSTASDPGSSKGSRKIANTSDSTEHGVSDTVSNPTGSVAKGKQCADSIPTVVQAGSHSLLSSSNSTDDCKGSFCIDDQTPQQLLQENAEKYQPVQAQQTSAMSCRAHATAQQDLTTRNDTAHGLQGQQAHVPQWQQQQLQVHKDTPQSSDRPAHQTMVSPPRQVGLRRLTGQYSYSGGVTGSGRTVVRTLSQSGNPAAHMMQRLD